MRPGMDSLNPYSAEPVALLPDHREKPYRGNYVNDYIKQTQLIIF